MRGRPPRPKGAVRCRIVVDSPSKIEAGVVEAAAGVTP
jgi:hypothetical protein